MYGYSSYGSDLFSLLGFAGGIWLSLTFIAFVAAIVCTVLLYRKYVSSFDKNQLKNAKHDFGPFLRFWEILVRKDPHCSVYLQHVFYCLRERCSGYQPSFDAYL